MASPAAKAVEPPKTLPPDFFDKQGAQDTLPANFDFGDKAPDQPQGNALQRAFDTATTVTPEQEKGHSWLTNKAQEFGAGAIQGVGQPFVHPLQTLGSIGNTLAHPIDSLHADVDNVRAHPAQFLGNLAGGAPLAELGGEAMGAANIPKISADLGERFGGYKSPVIDPALQNASKLATAIRPPQGVDFDLEGNLAQQMPLIKAFAQKTGNPLHSQWEGAQAARQLADQGKTHFKENVLGPNAEAQIPVTGLQQYQGFTGPNITQGRMNLGQIEGRIGEINNLLRPAGGAKTAGASLTALEKAGWMKELNMLQNKLYTELGQRSGLEPEAIKGMRQNYGQQYDIADTIDSARRARLGPQGAAAEGGSIPLSKTGALDKLATWARGGQEYLANKNFRKAASPFAPVEPEFPQPQYPQKLQGDEFNNPFLNRTPPSPANRTSPFAAPSQEVPTFGKEPDPGAVSDLNAKITGRIENIKTQRAQQVQAAEANRGAAQQEFLHGTNLEQAAQDAAAQRSQRAAGLRTGRQATAAEAKKLEGESARTIGRRNAMNQRSQ